MNVILLIAYNRPDYTQRVLDALGQCERVEKFTVVAHVDAGDSAVVHVIRSHPLAPVTRLRSHRVGCDANVSAALRDGFALSDYLVILEDDTVPAQDFLLFHEFCREKYREDHWVLSCAGYNQPDRPLSAGQEHAVRRHPWFTPWGWGTWRDRYEQFIRPAMSAASKPSWDRRIGDAIKRREKPLLEVRPILSRVLNIGAEGGAHAGSARAHRQRHWCGAWADGVQSGEFHEVFD